MCGLQAVDPAVCAGDTNAAAAVAAEGQGEEIACDGGAGGGGGATRVVMGVVRICRSAADGVVACRVWENGFRERLITSTAFAPN